MNKTLIAALVAATALLAPAAAQAATVSLENGAIVYRGADTEDLDLLVSTFKPYDSDITYLSLNDDVPQTILSGPCFMSEGYDPNALCPLNPGQPLVIQGGAGNDYVSVFSSDVPDAKPIAMNGNGGNDTLKDAYNSTAGRTLDRRPWQRQDRGLRRQRRHRRRRRQRHGRRRRGQRQRARRRGRRRDVGRPLQAARRRPARRRPRHRHHRGVGHPVRPHEPAAHQRLARRRGQRRPARRGRQRHRHRAHPRSVVGDYVGSEGPTRSR